MVTNCYIKKLKLNNFRNHSSFRLDLSNDSVVIFGQNGIGKTNILEAISLLAKSNGMKKAKASEMQNRFSNKDWAVHYGFFNGVDFNSIGIAKSLNKKLVQIDGKLQSSYSSLYRISNVIWLIPQMDYILLNPPSDRLKLLDRIVSLFEENYIYCYIKYKKAKDQRSKLLRKNILDENWLSILEKIMAVNAVNISHMRLSVLKTLQNTINNYSTEFLPKASLKFSSQLISSNTPEYLQSRLRENREIDSLTGKVNFCINNDKFQIFCQKKGVPVNLCSTGEQKLLLLSIILSSVKARCIFYNKAPLLLLDDIMSHLDKYYRRVLIEEVLSIQCQTWITDIDRKNFDGHINSFRFIELQTNQMCSD
ncbi:DNA replication/repair protein RecF [Wolbachia endosymbiont of Cruorifilaria tuberocauda]|uniref:DNA replication/repair protein RecF n=1 Tax=Wolbachia endosymbiont of Cruorifilaria tuberocauda TaxID=1812111 RepID=UPI00158F5A1A|nr:DNA replication/repair protein RecF [Wolbachia endosymbiont of Cruorifilaria tuberocauda]QKX01407.1 DNA replication/repair protein RecF [Wolbachia endosymbiont of Cruorifilaria tuberocauda]